MKVGSYTTAEKTNTKSSVIDELTTSYAAGYVIKNEEVQKEQQYKEVTERGHIITKLLKLRDDSDNYTIKEYIEFYLPAKVNMTDIVNNIKDIIPFYKKFFEFLKKKEVGINIIPTKKLLKEVALLELDRPTNSICSITIFITESESSPVTADKLLHLLGALLHACLYKEINYKKYISLYAYYSPTSEVQEFGKERVVKDSIFVSYLDESKTDLVFHDNEYFICTCKCNLEEVIGIQCIHPMLLTQLEYLYKKIEKEC